MLLKHPREPRRLQKTQNVTILRHVGVDKRGKASSAQFALRSLQSLGCLQIRLAHTTPLELQSSRGTARWIGHRSAFVNEERTREKCEATPT